MGYHRGRALRFGLCHTLGNYSVTHHAGKRFVAKFGRLASVAFCKALAYAWGSVTTVGSVTARVQLPPPRALGVRVRCRRPGNDALDPDTSKRHRNEPA
jgi:hypothetical protein